MSSVGAELLAEASAHRCRACDEEGPVAFYESVAIPTQTCVLLDTRAEASSYPVGDLLLAFCESCGFIQNVRFDPDLVDYSQPTEESQAFSPLFQEFATGLADELVRSHDLAGRSVLEIGCGKGDFLALLAERGIISGHGIDPGFLPNRPEIDEHILRFDRDWYGRSSAHLTADLVLTRHLLEHVHNVGEFFGWLAQSTLSTSGAALFTEVPDAQRVLEEGAFWDIYYEHCSYFTLGSLARTIRRVGLDVTDLRMGFADQYLLATAHAGRGRGPFPAEDQPDEVGAAVARFSRNAAASIDRWRSLIDRTTATGRPVALWGGGSKAVAFLSTIGVGDVVVVDINPHKQGKWLPAVGIEVRPPELLRGVAPELVIPMNPIYVNEIRADLHGMGLDPSIQAL